MFFVFFVIQFFFMSYSVSVDIYRRDYMKFFYTKYHEAANSPGDYEFFKKQCSNFYIFSSIICSLLLLRICKRSSGSTENQKGGRYRLIIQNFTEYQYR